MKHKQKWGGLVQNGRAGSRTPRHTGMCQHVAGYEGATPQHNQRTGACPAHTNPLGHVGLVHKPFAALEMLVGIPNTAWPTFTVHGAR
jgi:hypothetical protein